MKLRAHNLIADKFFKVNVLSKTDKPNHLAYLAALSEVYEGDLSEATAELELLQENELGKRLVQWHLKENQWKALEHPCITFSVQGFPASVLSVILQRRIGVAVTARSQDKSGELIADLGISLQADSPDSTANDQQVKQLFYLRPVGRYLNTEGSDYLYGADRRELDFTIIKQQAILYGTKICNHNYAYAQAKDSLPQSVRQDFIISFSARSVLRFCDEFTSENNEPEVRTLSYLILSLVKSWMPEVVRFYQEKRLGKKNKMAP